ncbi:MAG: rhodanese-like domain-containing protein [Gammaproteobacteria bacterium]
MWNPVFAFAGLLATSFICAGAGANETGERQAPCALVEPDARHPANTVWVDTRGAPEFARYRIPGSINLPVHAIKTSNLIRDRSLVLVAADHDVSALQSECAKLATAGSGSVSILSGGLDAWQRSGGALDGDPPPLSSVTLISARAVFAHRDKHPWLVVSLAASDLVRHHFEQSISLPHPHGNPRRFNAQLEAAIEASALQDPFILFVGKNGNEAPEALVHIDVRNAFFLHGGIENYDRYIGRHRAIWSKRDSELAVLECEAVQ